MVTYYDKNGQKFVVKELWKCCPDCKGTSIEYSDNEFDYDSCWQSARCEHCGLQWYDNYVSTGSERD